MAVIFRRLDGGSDWFVESDGVGYTRPPRDPFVLLPAPLFRRLPDGRWVVMDGGPPAREVEPEAVLDAMADWGIVIQAVRWPSGSEVRRECIGSPPHDLREAVSKQRAGLPWFLGGPKRADAATAELHPEPVGPGSDEVVSAMREIRPSRDELVMAYRRLWALQLTARGSYREFWAQENEMLPYMTAVFDALAPIRSTIDRFQGWPRRLQRANRVAIQFVDSLIEAWGWEWLVALPEKDRAAAVAERRRLFHEPIHRELMLTALAVESAWMGMEGYDEWADWDRAGNPSIEVWAEVAREAGLAVTMTPAEGKERFKAAARKQVNTPTLGTCYPTFDAIGKSHDEGLRHEFSRAVGIIRVDLEITDSVRPWQPDEDEPTVQSETQKPDRTPSSGAAEDRVDCTSLDLVRLDQAAALVNRSKRTLESLKRRDDFPMPAVEGGGGKPHFYDWKVLGPFLANVYAMRLPERFPKLNRRNA